MRRLLGWFRRRRHYARVSPAGRLLRAWRLDEDGVPTGAPIELSGYTIEFDMTPLITGLRWTSPLLYAAFTGRLSQISIDLLDLILGYPYEAGFQAERFAHAASRRIYHSIEVKSATGAMVLRFDREEWV